MIASLLVAGAVVFPAAGTYAYEINTPSGRRFHTTVVIARAADGVTTHETFGDTNTIATTAQHFDNSLHERWFAATQVGSGNSLTITFSGALAIYNTGGKVLKAPLKDPACVLVEDNVLTSAVMLPAVLRTTNAEHCTFAYSTSVQTVVADVVNAPAEARPARAAAADASVTVQIGGITETVWYDPRTLIPDYVDFGAEAGYAVLIR
ncbi:MAG: hypothetical protein WBD74_12345 [Candidatus Aquilonibacter sp.]